ncbi:MAG TPA: LapA family protein [Burkholderiales bacterium]|nr:LapA family protein [Burkholderiales bacterium]
MRYLRLILGIVLFLVFLGFAIKNSDTVVLRYFLGWEWHAALSLVLLVFFTAGAVLGVLAAMSTLQHRRRELAQLRRELHAARAAPQAQDAHPERQLL